MSKKNDSGIFVNKNTLSKMYIFGKFKILSFLILQ